jgi:peptide/nickel transport system substrate-binding protein
MRVRLPVRRAAAIGAALAAAVLLAAGCGSGGAPSGSTSASGAVIPSFTVGTTETESTLDEAKNFGSYQIDDLALDTLLTLGPQAQLQPNLATSVTQPNPVTYVYHLRHGVKFWDGDPLTSADVVYTYNYIRAAGSQAAYVFPAVKSITADGPNTVVVTLPGPDPAWKYTPALTFTGIFEAKFAEEHKSTFGQPSTLIMGSGPWEVGSLDPTTGAQLSANPHWWGGKVPIQHVSVKLYSNETSLALAFRAGEVDLDPYITAPQAFATTSGAKLLTSSSCDDTFITLNTQIAPWNDVHVRRAVAYALNRTDIIAAAGGYAAPLDTFISPGNLETIASASQVSQLLSTLNRYPYSTAKAEQEMAQSAYPHGVSTTIQTWTGGAVNQAQVIAAELAKIGINAKLKVIPLSQAEVEATGVAGQRPTTVWEGGCTTPDASGYDFYLGSANTKAGSWNEADWAPASVDSALAAGTSTDNPAKRFAAFSSVLEQMSSDVPYVPLYLSEFTAALSSKYSDPAFSYWYYDDNNYLLGIKAS